MYLKTFDMAFLEIVRHLRADLGTSIDLVEGSDTRSLAEAVAFQVADLSERQERSILEAIPESTFEAFGFASLAAKPAQGVLQFYTPVPAADVILIPVGTEALDSLDQVFVTTADAYIAPGQTSVDVPAVAQGGGEISNVSALSIIRLGSGIAGVQGVTNPAPFTGGADAEALDAQIARFASWWQAMNGSNKAGLTAAILNTDSNGEQVTNAQVLDMDDDPTIRPAYMVVCAYRLGGVSNGLKAAIQAAVRRMRAGGVMVSYEWTPGTPIPISVILTCPDTSSQAQAIASVRAAVAAYFAGLNYGNKVSYENLITVCTTAHPAIAEVLVTTPTGGDVPCAPRQHLELGNLTVTAGSA